MLCKLGTVPLLKRSKGKRRHVELPLGVPLDGPGACGTGPIPSLHFSLGMRNLALSGVLH